MHRAMIWGAVVMLLAAGAVQGVMVTISGPANVQDSILRADAADANLGQNATDRQWRMFSDTNAVQRHNLMKFALPADLAGATDITATVNIYVRRYGGTVADVTGYKISRLLPGKGWLEGTNDWSTPAVAGDVTWNSQAHGSTLWATPGATGAADIDQASTVSWNLAGGPNDGSADGWVPAIDISALVQAWAGGAENNGMVWWGGSGGSDSSRYNWSYDSDTNTQPSRAPFLTISYTPTPEPASLILLVLGAAPLLRRRR